MAHNHRKIMGWLAGKRLVTLHFTPAHASWLNQAEIRFNIFARDVLRDGVWCSRQAFVGQIMEYIGNDNRLGSKPFTWTDTRKPLTV